VRRCHGKAPESIDCRENRASIDGFFKTLFRILNLRQSGCFIIIISQNFPFKIVIHLDTEVERHRLSAFTDGLLIGLGLLLVIWALSSIASLSFGNSIFCMVQILSGVLMFAAGGFREAYAWGRFSSESDVPRQVLTRQTQSNRPLRTSGFSSQTTTTHVPARSQTNLSRVTAEQIRSYPGSTQARETAVLKEDKQQT